MASFKVYNGHMRKTYSGKFKAKIVLEILREEKTISEIASQYEVHPNQLSKWKREAINGLANVLEDGRKKSDKEKEALEKKTQELYTEIGKLTTQLNWLKKKSGIELE